MRKIRGGTLASLRFALVIGVILPGLAPPAGAGGVVQVNFKPHFNADVVLNGSPGSFDTTMDSIEGVWSFVTDSAGAGALCGGPFLPDDAFFTGNAQHPDTQLGWRNSDDGDNVWQTVDATGEITVQVPNLAYDSIFLYATGAWDTFLDVTLNYTTGSPEVISGIAYPSWFDEAPAGFFNLVDGLDRGNFDVNFDLVCENVDDPGIVGRLIPVDTTRTLDSFTLTRTDDDQGTLNVFGATAMLARQVYNYDLSGVFNADLVGNTGSCAIADFDHVHDALEDGFVMPTQTMATCQEAGSPGLPNDGVFPVNGQHPRFQLAFSNGDSGWNARHSPPGEGDDVYVINTIDAAVDEVHLFGAAGVGYAVLGVKFFFSTGSPIDNSGEFVEWWFADGGQLGPGAYYLVDGMDPVRTNGPGMLAIWNNSDAALFGLPIPADPSRVLTSIEITSYDPTGWPVPQSTLGLFGAAGVRFADDYLFLDDFETGDPTAWSAISPP